MKKLLLFLIFFILFSPIVFAQTICFEDIRLSRRVPVNDIVVDTTSGVIYEGRGRNGYCWTGASIVSSTQGEENWEVTIPESSWVTDLLLWDDYVVAVGLSLASIDYTDPYTDGVFFTMFNKETRAQEFSFIFNYDNLFLVDLEDFNQDSPNEKRMNPHLLKLPGDGFLVSGYGGHLFFIDPEHPNPYTVIDLGSGFIVEFENDIRAMHYVTDSLITVATKDSIFLLNAYTKALIPDWNYVLEDESELIAANNQGELFVIRDNQIIEIYPDEEVIVSLPSDYVINAFKCDANAFVVAGRDLDVELDFIQRYENGILTEAHFALHKCQRINGVAPLEDHYIYWGRDCSSEDEHPYYTNMIAAQPKGEPTCDYGRDIALIGLETIDSSIVSSLVDYGDGHGRLQYDIELRLKATIVNEGAPIDSFTIRGSSLFGYFCYSYWNIDEEFDVSMETGDTLTIDNIILHYSNGHYEFNSGNSGYFHFHIDRQIVVETPDWKQDDDISDNSFPFHFEYDFLLTGVEDPPTEKIDDISVFPNPASKEFRIISPAGNVIDVLYIYDLKGKRVLSYKDINSPQTVVNCQDFPSGMYILTVISESGSQQVKKLLVR